MVFLEFPVIEREAGKVYKSTSSSGKIAVAKDSLAVVQEVVGHVVANVSENASAVHQHCCIPVVEKDDVRKFVKWSGQDHKQSGRHDQPIFIHWKIVVDSMQEEMERDSDSVIRKKSRGG